MEESCLCSLRHLTSQHPFSYDVQTEVRSLGGLELTVQKLQLATTWPVIKAATGLVRNLLNCEENHQTLVELKIIPRLGQLLALSVKEERKVSYAYRCEAQNAYITQFSFSVC